MAVEANYRPAAPSDGCGHITLSRGETLSVERLACEAANYAMKFNAEDDDLDFHIGCSNYTTNRALVFVIEAARSLCGAQDDLALELLKMAVREVKREGKV
jgi:hypothetical protein